MPALKTWGDAGLKDLALQLLHAKKECLSSSLDCLAALKQVRYRAWFFLQDWELIVKAIKSLMFWWWMLQWWSLFASLEWLSPSLHISVVLIMVRNVGLLLWLRMRQSAWWWWWWWWWWCWWWCWWRCCKCFCCCCCWWWWWWWWKQCCCSCC